MYVCMFVYIHVCIYVPMYLCIYIYTYNMYVCLIQKTSHAHPSQTWFTHGRVPLPAASAKVIRPSLQTPRTTASVVFRPHHHRQHHQQEQAGRRSGRSNSGASSLAADGVGNIGMRLDGSSSSPVEPIKPLLDLSSVGEGASQAVPPYPMFDEAAPRNVSGLTGNAAYLHCIVHNLGNKSVSIRVGFCDLCCWFISFYYYY